jgi:predicted nucleotidyltransferase
MSALRPEIADLARRYRALLELDFGSRLCEVVVFGSQARGDADTESDLDVAVVISDLTESERSRAIRLAFEAWWAGGRRGPLLQPLVWSDVEREECTADERRIALDIQREGVPV